MQLDSRARIQPRMKLLLGALLYACLWFVAANTVFARGAPASPPAIATIEHGPYTVGLSTGTLLGSTDHAVPKFPLGLGTLLRVELDVERVLEQEYYWESLQTAASCTFRFNTSNHAAPPGSTGQTYWTTQFWGRLSGLGNTLLGVSTVTTQVYLATVDHPFDGTIDWGGLSGGNDAETRQLDVLHEANDSDVLDAVSSHVGGTWTLRGTNTYHAHTAIGCGSAATIHNNQARYQVTVRYVYQ